MRRKLTLAGLTLLLLSFVTVTQAYHITGSAGPIGTSHQWNGATAIPDPTSPGSILFAVPVCESDDILGGGPPAPVIATPGMGALCFMSPGYVLVGGSCIPTARSNGNDRTCGGSVLPTLGSDWIDVQMLDSNGNPVPFLGQIDGHSCVTPTTTFRYDGTYAYTVDGNGHVAGFPTEFAAYLAPGVGNPLALGTYTTSAAAAGVASGCDAPRPFDQI